MILVYVQHLLGTGHLQRMRLIADELIHQGVPVTIVSGGMPSGLLKQCLADVIQLEPVRSNGLDFSLLIDQHGVPVDSKIYERRCRHLLAVIDKVQPDLLLVESFPFGRRKFRSELLPVFERLRNGPAVVPIFCSIRDVLQLRSPDRDEETARWVNQYFDSVLVHGDAGFLPLENSFSCVASIREKIRYTGYVAPAPVPRVLDHVGLKGEIIISAGGGAAGKSIYQNALLAAQQGSLGRQWHMLIGRGISDEDFSVLSGTAPGCMTVERNRDDFRELLAKCSVCVSQAGYNTVMDLVVTGAPSVLIPFEGEGETEQVMRARAMASKMRARLLPEKELAPDSLLKKIASVFETDPPALPEIDLEGSANTADILIDALKQVGH